MGSSRLRFAHTSRSGTYNRVADPDWEDPLDGLPGVAAGGRWNPPGSFPVVYLNKSLPLARLFIAHKLMGHPYGPEDLDPEEAPVLALTDVPDDSYVDIVTDSGCAQAGLPVTYPSTAQGEVITHTACWPIGEEAWRIGEPGIACRSATVGAASSDEELAWFQRENQLHARDVMGFSKWFFQGS